MNKKYQKPVSRNLGDLAVAEGTCTNGIGVRSNTCNTGSNYYLCSFGGFFNAGSCVDGVSASTNCNTGLSAL
jgi:hypothetical protein